MVLRSETGREMEDEVSHDESTSDDESVDGEGNEQGEEEVDGQDEEEEEKGEGSDQDDDESGDEDSSEEIVEIKGTKFNVSKAAKEALVDDDDDGNNNGNADDSYEDGDADDSGEDEDDDADDEDQDSDAENDEPQPDGDNDHEDAGKSGWADAMAKVLNMGKDSEQSPGLLSKAKLDNFQIKEKTTDDGEAAAGQPRDSIKRLIKKEMEEKGRVKPNIVRDRAREKILSRLATRGVVQLFNAVKEQQKDLKSKLEQVGGSVRKREKVYKNIDKEGFLEVLSGNNKRRETPVTATHEQASAKKKAKVKAEEQDEEDTGGWSVIRDDYMLGAKMKDWDKESDADEA